MNARGRPLVAIGLVAGLNVRLAAQASPHPFQATDYYKLASVGEPRPAPDGRRIAFVVTTVVEDKDRRHSEIWMAPADGSSPAFRYTSPATEASSPVWSPDGSLLAFTSKREGFDDDVWFLRTGAPGGEAIVFVQDSTDTSEVRNQVRPQLYVLNVADGAVRRLATPYVENVEPAWSPDGNAIAFICSKGRGEENDVCVIPAAGGGGPVRNLTSGWDLDPSGPAWSPGAKTVYLGAEPRGNLHAFAAPATGGA